MRGSPCRKQRSRGLRLSTPMTDRPVHSYLETFYLFGRLTNQYSISTLLTSTFCGFS
jgi:hypothetical protein